MQNFTPSRPIHVSCSWDKLHRSLNVLHFLLLLPTTCCRKAYYDWHNATSVSLSEHGSYSFRLIYITYSNKFDTVEKLVHFAVATLNTPYRCSLHPKSLREPYPPPKITSTTFAITVQQWFGLNKIDLWCEKSEFTRMFSITSTKKLV